MKLRIFPLSLGMLALACGGAPAVAGAMTATPGMAASTTIAAIAEEAPHRYFGTLQTVNGHLITIQLRDGRVLRVDATRAFALKRVAEPLFRGKPTVVDGTLGAAGIFEASAVKRGAPLRINWGVDR